MPNELKVLEQALACVTGEQSSLRTECSAFRDFREKASLARPVRSGSPDTGTEVTQLLEAYQETVMSTPDFETTYGDSLAESLGAEFPPSVMNVLLSDKQITQRRKRDLLVAINGAIEERQRFCELLEMELESLRSIRTTVHNVHTTLEELPPLSVTELTFEEYVGAWETTEELIDRCDRLLEQRQDCITELEDIDGDPNKEPHALNQYLYRDQETIYPGLRAIAETQSRIQRYRGTTETGVSADCERARITHDRHDTSTASGSSD
jgi:exonuclease VII small subunit